MQFRVPQNITMEDRIAGPLTLVQFSILVLGGGVSFLVLSSPLLFSPLNKIAGAGCAMITLLLSLTHFNGQPMYRAFRFFISYIFSPKTRVWHKTGHEVQLIRPSSGHDQQKQHAPAKHISKEDIHRLSTVLDSRGQAGVIPAVGTKTKSQQKPSAKPS